MLTETKTPKRQEITPFDPQRMRCHTQTCRRPLHRLGEPWNCWICLHCNVHPKEAQRRAAEKHPDQNPHAYIKDSMTPNEIQELVNKSVAAALAKQAEVKPPKYKDDTTEASKSAPSDQDDEEPEILGKTLDQFPDKETTDLTKEN